MELRYGVVPSPLQLLYPTMVLSTGQVKEAAQLDKRTKANRTESSVLMDPALLAGFVRYQRGNCSSEFRESVNYNLAWFSRGVAVAKQSAALLLLLFTKGR